VFQFAQKELAPKAAEIDRENTFREMRVSICDNCHAKLHAMYSAWCCCYFDVIVNLSVLYWYLFDIFLFVYIVWKSENNVCAQDFWKKCGELGLLGITAPCMFSFLFVIRIENSNYFKHMASKMHCLFYILNKYFGLIPFGWDMVVKQVLILISSEDSVVLYVAVENNVGLINKNK